MLQHYLPIIVVVVFNTFYQIAAKEMPAKANPLALLIISYLIAAACACIAFFVTDEEKSLTAQFQHLNWAPIALGICLILLETGFIMMYRSDWDISLGSLVCNIAMAVILIAVGILFYKEHISVNQIIGVLLCLAGLIFINR